MSRFYNRISGDCRRAFCRARGTDGAARHPYQAFSLIELLVTVALLSVIILGLVAMFNQTRRAFTSSMTQVDVLSAGRSAADLLARELEQMAPTYYQNVDNLYIVTPNNNVTLAQTLTDTNDPKDLKINILQAVYFVTRSNQTWNCIGYRLATSDYANSIGTLYRFSSNNIPYTSSGVLINNQNSFLNTTPPTNFYNRIIDGVVDFRVRVYDGYGNFMSFTNNSVTVIIPVTNTVSHEIVLDNAQAQFTSNTLPAYVELELGILEDRALARYQALSLNSAAAQSYLKSHAAQVHIFRRRIPIRNVNSSVYP